MRLLWGMFVGLLVMLVVLTLYTIQSYTAGDPGELPYYALATGFVLLLAMACYRMIRGVDGASE